MPLRLATLITVAAGPALATGFQFMEIPATADMPPIEAAVWYPSDAAVPDAPNTPFGQAFVMHTPRGRQRPAAGGDLAWRRAAGSAATHRWPSPWPRRA